MTATPTPLRELIAKAIADHIGHGMAEKCEGHADAVLAALSARDAAGECECKGTGFIGQHLPNGDYEPDTWTCPKHTPPASGEAGAVGEPFLWIDPRQFDRVRRFANDPHVVGRRYAPTWLKKYDDDYIPLFLAALATPPASAGASNG